MAANEEIKQQINELINEYALKLKESQRALDEQAADYRILRSNYLKLEAEVANLQQDTALELEAQQQQARDEQGELARVNQELSQQLSEAARQNRQKTIWLSITAGLAVLAVVAAGYFAISGSGLSSETKKSGASSESRQRRHHNKHKIASAADSDDQSSTQPAKSATDDSSDKDNTANADSQKSDNQDTNDNN